jgi:ribosomal RNA-processing protein 12
MEPTVSTVSTGSAVSHSHHRINTILSALGEAIRSQQTTPAEAHEPTPTEYFLVIFRSLSVSPEMSEHVVDMLIILSAVIPKVSRAILRDQFKGVSLLISKIIQKSESSKVLRLCIDILGGLLEVQDHSEGFWSGIQTLKIVNMYLGLIDDERVRIRKSVHNTLVRLLKEHKKTNSHSLSSYVGEFCYEILKACTRSEYKRALAVVQFLENSLALLSSDRILQIIDVALRLPACNQPVLSAAMLKMMDSFYQSPFLTLNVPQLFECVRFLVAMPPNTLDMEANAFYCTALASGLLRIKDYTDNVALPELLVSACVCLVRACETDFTQIHCAIATALKRIIYGFVTESLIAESVSRSQATNNSSSANVSPTYLHRFLSGVEILLQLRYQQSWIYILDAVRALFEVIRGKNATILLSSYIVKLADVYQAIETGLLTVETPILLAVGDTLGTVMKCTGVVNFLSVVPFTLTTTTQTSDQTQQQVVVDNSREWILSIMHNTLKTVPCALAEFGQAILPLASQCNGMVQHPEKFNLASHSNNPFQLKQLRNRVLQLWSTFPDFVSFGCPDISKSFPGAANVLLGALKDQSYPELLPIIINGLTHIARNVLEKATPASGAQSGAAGGSAAVKLIETADVKGLRNFTGAIIPAILDFLETIDITDVRFQNCVTCVSLWVALATPPQVTAVTRKLLQLLLTSTQIMAEQSSSSDAAGAAMNVDNGTGPTAEENIAAGWMSVLRAIIPHLTNELVVLLFKTVRPLLSIDESLSVQKRAYHVLDGLLQTHGEVIYTNEEPSMSILGVISESLLTCHVSARNMRLRCIDTLFHSLSDEEISLAASNLLGEILICQRDSNQKSRLAAITLLKTLIVRVSTQQMLMQLCSAIVGETTIMRSSGIVGLCVLLLEKRHDAQDGAMLLQQAAVLLPTISILLREECAEQTRAIMSFIRVCCASLPLNMLQAHIDSNESSSSASLVPHIMQAVCMDIGSLKPKFSSRIRAVFRKLIQRVGVDYIAPLVPDADMGLLEYIIRQNRRNFRKKLVKEKANRDEVAKMLGSDSESEDDSVDEDDEDIDKNKVTISRPKAVRSKDIMTSSLPTTLDNLLEDQPASFMAAMSSSSNAVSGRKRYKAKRPNNNENSGSMNIDHGSAGSGDHDDDDEDYKVVMSADGKICVTATNSAVSNANTKILSLAENMKQSLAAKDHKDDDEDDDKRAHGNNRGNTAAGKKARTKDPGEEYRSKKAGGDVWKKGMLAPHAYIPLDPKLLSKKNKADALSKLGVVVGGSNQAFAAGAGAGSGKNKMKGKTVLGNRNQRKSGRDHHKSGK